MKKTLLSFALIVTLPLTTAAYCRDASDLQQEDTDTATEEGSGIVSAADPRAAEAGREMLRKGGSASDAAMAMMLALTVVEPQSSGFGGGGFLLHHDADTRLIETIDGRETAPSSADESLFLDDNGNPLGFMDAFQGGHSVGVPGNIRLMAMVHQRWGKLEWAELFGPAIRLAEEGYTVNKTLEGRLDRLKDIWERFPDARAIYWQDGGPKKMGDRVTNPAIAKTLRAIAEQGPDAFYTGPIAQEIVDTVSNSSVNPVRMTMADMAAYQAKPRPPVCMPYREYKICGMGPPSSGATTVMQILGTLKSFDMKKLGKDNPKAWHLIGEAMQLAYADRESYLGDPDFVSVPVAGMIDPKYLASRAKLISPTRSLPSYEAGTPPGFEPRTAAISSEVSGTTHFVARDSAGNLVSMTSTIEGPFGSQLVAGGMFLNNELTDFTFAPMRDGAPVANRVQPGKRPLSSMSPTIVYKDDKPVLAIGSAGGKRIIMHVAKSLIGYIDFDLPVDEAIALPNIYFRRGDLLVEQDTPLAAMAAQIERFGQPVKPVYLPSKLNAVAWTPDGWVGAADPRSEGVALRQ
ncbi:gamma-glutamyltransferase [Alterisphingorhabdus coralli]|uniref:Glutathione hydrolase proenzyme n=1 Tax=Alterisphingorhabdus coralli TaxID=3071408 RepID=A0AA97F6L0_9SPHN|nr:gamma-glutamyltransferase [Parasphingorhabdus sp. SCSIO 66989]WOE75309.1 gamma-glutamyltransferase [Parasphingorhabdus sp. SCSIO 66989]